MTSQNGKHANGAANGRRNGHAPLNETTTLVQVSPAGGQGPELQVISTIPAAGLAPDAAGSSEVSGQDNSRQESAPVHDSAQPWYERYRERTGTPRREWPVEAERASDRLGNKPALAVELLVLGMTITDVARQLGVHRSTVHRWYEDPFFVAQLEARREELVGSMLDQQLLAGRIATAKLIELMDSANEPIALRAAATLYAGGQKAYQSIDVRKRIERLEDHMHITYGYRV